jgi:hypothetical protein
VVIGGSVDRAVCADMEGFNALVNASREIKFIGIK